MSSVMGIIFHYEQIKNIKKEEILPLGKINYDKIYIKNPELKTIINKLNDHIPS